MSVKTKSFLRKEENKLLSNLYIDGDILDVGGSKKSGYHDLIKGNHKILTGNIDEFYDIDIKFDATKNWPFEESKFDGVLFINVLEHLYEYRKTLEEGYRVLKKGGKMAGVVPFMFNVHGSPSDYFRYTNFALQKMFEDVGFVDIKIKELGTGAFSVGYHVFIGFFRWVWLASVFMFIAKVLDRVLSSLKPSNKMSSKYMPLGYYFEASK